MIPPIQPRAVNVGTAAMLYGVSSDVIRAAIRAHQSGQPGLPAKKLGARWSIRTADLEAWYARQGTAA